MRRLALAPLMRSSHTFSSSLTLRLVSVMRILCMGASVPSKPVAVFLMMGADMRRERGETTGDSDKQQHTQHTKKHGEKQATARGGAARERNAARAVHRVVCEPRCGDAGRHARSHQRIERTSPRNTTAWQARTHQSMESKAHCSNEPKKGKTRLSNLKDVCKLIIETSINIKSICIRVQEPCM